MVAADVYSVAPHVGRGGWTWYTGSAGWMYRAGLEFILGLRVLGERLKLVPCLPEQWARAEISYRHRSARYEIVIENPLHVTGGIASLELDGVRLADGMDTIESARRWWCTSRADRTRGTDLEYAIGTFRVIAKIQTARSLCLLPALISGHFGCVGSVGSVFVVH